MSGKPVKAAAILLFAILGSGCASQNAMTTLPEEVRMTLLADQARSAMAENGEKEGENGDDMGGHKPGADELSEEERLFRQRQRHPDRFDHTVGDEQPTLARNNQPKPDAREIFAQAMKLRSKAADANGIADTVEEDARKETEAETELPVNEVWQRALAIHENNAASRSQKQETEASSSRVMTDDLITTAAVERREDAIPVPQEDDIFVFSLDNEDHLARSGSNDILNREAFMQLALRRKGGRLPRHITVGRLRGESHEILKYAHEISTAITTITGGNPSFGYDPSIEERMVRIEYNARSTPERAS